MRLLSGPESSGLKFESLISSLDWEVRFHLGRQSSMSRFLSTRCDARHLFRGSVLLSEGQLLPLHLHANESLCTSILSGLVFLVWGLSMPNVGAIEPRPPILTHFMSMLYRHFPLLILHFPGFTQSFSLWLWHACTLSHVSQLCWHLPGTLSVL